MRQLEHVMDSAAKYPQVLFRKMCVSGGINSFVSDKGVEITKTVILSFL